MLIGEDYIIVKGRKFALHEVEAILVNHIEESNKQKQQDKLKNNHNESLVEYCKRAYINHPDLCDNFHHLSVLKPYTSKRTKHKYDYRYYDNMTIRSILSITHRWKDYIVTNVRYGADCCTYVSAELPCKSVADLLHYCSNDFNSECIFQEVITNEIYDFNFVNQYKDKFKSTVYIQEVETDKDNKIIKVYYMNNGGGNTDA